jgi:DUF2934 family protein
LTCLASKRYGFISRRFCRRKTKGYRHGKKECPTPKEDPTKKPPATVLGESQELENQIRQRAYELYEARGREDGHDLEDWLHAEEEITAKTVRGVAA